METSLLVSAPDTKPKKHSMDIVKDNLKTLEICVKDLYEETENRSGLDKDTL